MATQLLSHLISYGFGGQPEVKPAEGTCLGPEIKLSDSDYAKVEPLFPKLHKKGQPLPRPSVRIINFKKSNLPEYDEYDCYAAVIDNAFSLEECRELIRIAEKSSDVGWPLAQ